MSLVETAADPAPKGAVVDWLDASDGTRFRVARWCPPDASRGTVVVLPGRTEFIEKYFERFARVREYIDTVREQALRDGAVRTLFGRVRWFPQFRQRISRVAQEQALRAAVNTTIQGTAADLMKMAMLSVDRALAEAGSGARVLLQVHDELLLEVPRAEIDPTIDLVQRAMEEVHPLTVPLVVDQKTGESWQDVT